MLKACFVTHTRNLGFFEACDLSLSIWAVKAGYTCVYVPDDCSKF